MEKKYKQVSSTNWNKGEDSGMLPLERLKIHNLWLELNHKECKATSTKETEVTEGIDNKWDNDLQGFVKF